MRFLTRWPETRQETHCYEIGFIYFNQIFRRHVSDGCPAWIFALSFWKLWIIWSAFLPSSVLSYASATRLLTRKGTDNHHRLLIWDQRHSVSWWYNLEHRDLRGIPIGIEIGRWPVVLGANYRNSKLRWHPKIEALSECNAWRAVAISNSYGHNGQTDLLPAKSYRRPSWDLDKEQSAWV